MNSMIEAQKEREQRQLALMRDMLIQPSLQFFALNHTLVNLSALVGELCLVEQEWKDYFIGHWWIVEEIYAVSLYHDQTEFDHEEISQVKTAFIEMLKMVNNKLIDYEDFYLEA